MCEILSKKLQKKKKRISYSPMFEWTKYEIK